MTFDPSIPGAGDYLASSQAEIQTNFNLINTYFNIDHVALDAASDQGKHNQSTYMSTGAFPAPPGTALGEGAVYVSNTAAAREYAYYQRENNGVEIPFSMIGGFAKFNQAGVIVGRSFNINSPAVTALGAGRYQITLTTLDRDWETTYH